MSCSITNSAAWVALRQHRMQTKGMRIRDLLAQDTNRFIDFSAKIDHVFFDYSKHRVTRHTLELLMALAREAQLEQWRERLANGAVVNHSEKRTALHPVLRGSGNVSAEVKQTSDTLQEKAFNFVRQVRTGQATGASGKSFCHIVGIGIGGSYVGNKMLCRALATFGKGNLTVHFVNVGDADQTQTLLASLPTEETLFIAISKSFTTAETQLSIQHVRSRLNHYYNDNTSWQKHFAAVSTNEDALIKFGIPAERRFIIADSIGGRYSIWSAVSLPSMIFLGDENFKQFLSGAKRMDEHFFKRSLADNVPVILALIHFWYVNFYHSANRAIVVYDNALEYLPTYLQQLEMESNGKSVNREGIKCDYPTAPVVWGGQGLQGQHTFFQLLHQSKRLIPTDFIIAANTLCREPGYDDLLAVNFFAQIHALMAGEQVADPQQCNWGNQPSTAILLKEISPATIGALIAFYEHQVFVQAMLWQINPFDQWGVELGKKVSAQLTAGLEHQSDPLFNKTTGKLVQEYLRWKQ